MNIFETKRLTIREFTSDDIQRVFELSHENSFRLWHANEIYETFQEAAETVEFLTGNYTDKGYPLIYAVCLKENAELIGHIGLSGIREGLEIDYAICESYQRQGYASEALTSFCEFAGCKLGVGEIWGVVLNDNVASRKTLEKCGFIYSGTEGASHSVYRLLTKS